MPVVVIHEALDSSQVIDQRHPAVALVPIAVVALLLGVGIWAAVFGWMQQETAEKDSALYFSGQVTALLRAELQSILVNPILSTATLITTLPDWSTLAQKFPSVDAAVVSRIQVRMRKLAKICTSPCWSALGRGAGELSDNLLRVSLR